MEIKSLIDRINRLEKVVRKHINTHRYQVGFFKDPSNWNQICSSLYVIGDTICAIQSYCKSEFPNDDGLKYIYIYGLLQSLFLQQDSLRHLSEAFNVTYNASQTLLDIRGIRNAAIGHPTKQNQKGTRFYNYISRISMTKHGFGLLCRSEPRESDKVKVDIPREPDIEKVDILTMIRDQLSDVVRGYEKIAKKLEEADRVHKEKFKGTRIQDIFPSTMSYFLEKIAQGISAHSFGDRKFGQSNLEVLKETYEKYQAALSERNELSKHTESDLGEYFHAIKRLDEYLSGGGGSMEELDAYIYWEYLCNKHSSFVQIAKEIDEQYQA